MDNYTKFVENIYTLGTKYNRDFSIYHRPLPKPLKCPYPGSCKGGIGSACEIGYEGTLYATCSYNHYLRFNRCLECPSVIATVISCVAVVIFFALLFVMILWGTPNVQETKVLALWQMSSCPAPRSRLDFIKLFLAFSRHWLGSTGL